MIIENYLKKNDIRQSQFAETIGISRQLLNWHIKNPGARWPKDLAERIVKEVYGEVIMEKVFELVVGQV